LDDFGYDKRVPGGTLKPEDEQKRKLSHEIRSISHGLLGYLTILVEEIEDKLDDDEKELLNRVQYYSHKLSDLVLELLSNYNQEKNANKQNDWNK